MSGWWRSVVEFGMSHRSRSSPGIHPRPPVMSTVHLMELVVLAGVSVWVLAAVVVALLVGGMADGADDEAAPPHR